MAESKPYYRRSNHRYLSGDIKPPVATDSTFDLHESDIWNAAAPSPEFRKTAPNISKKSSSPVAKRPEIGGTPSSLPVNVPDWSKILKEEYSRNRRRHGDCDGDGYDSGEFDDGDGGGRWRIPPHEFIARTRIASFSVHEGIGRTLKGRDLSRVRNAIWEKIGFED